MFYNDGNIFLKTCFKDLDFIESYDLNSISNSILKTLSIKDFFKLNF